MIIKKLAGVLVAANLAMAPIAAQAAPLSTVGSTDMRASAPAGETSELKSGGVILILALLLLGAGAALGGGGAKDKDESEVPPISS